MIYEILREDGSVENVIVDAPETINLHYPMGNYREVVPVEAPQQPEMPTTPSLPTKITRLAFLNRFTDSEAITLDLASIGATVEAATIRRYLSKVNAAEYIDLSNTDTRQGVQMLEAAGMLSTGRALEILDSPVLHNEIAARV